MQEQKTLPMDAVMKMVSQLKDLSDKATNLHEAQAAAGKLAELMLKHNLTMRDLDEQSARTGATVKKQQVVMPRGADWKWRLLSLIATAHLGRAIRSQGDPLAGRPTVVTVFAHAHNLVVIKETYLWLITEINRLCMRDHTWAVQEGDTDALDRKQQWIGDYRYGAIDGLDDTYSTLMERFKRDVSGGSAMVLVRTEDVDKAVRQAFPLLGGAPRAQIRSTGAYEQGRAAGRGINVDRQVRADRPNGQIGG